jgi:hypothetical protein
MQRGGPEALDFFQRVQKAYYHFADVNSARIFIINQAENMLNSTGYKEKKIKNIISPHNKVSQI